MAVCRALGHRYAERRSLVYLATPREEGLQRSRLRIWLHRRPRPVDINQKLPQLFVKSTGRGLYKASETATELARHPSETTL